MKVVYTKSGLHEALPETAKIGFVPTMGALHQGHVSLVVASVQRNLYTVASIFVNPTQFNDPSDYNNYPVDTEADLAMLEMAGCDLVFMPTAQEIYPAGVDLSKYDHHFGALESKFEGAFRPGHFKGVGQVVHILFDFVKPDVAFFGEKDFQQLAVVKSLVRKTQMEIEVVGMRTIREPDGLAMSSRNRRLSSEERMESSVLYKALLLAHQLLHKAPIEEIHEQVQRLIGSTQHIKLEYFGIIDPVTFEPLSHADQVSAPHAVIAAYAGSIRLIDNVSLV